MCHILQPTWLKLVSCIHWVYSKKSTTSCQTRITH